HLSVDALAAGAAVGPALLDAVAAGARVELHPGDLLLVRTGHLARWPGTDAESRAALVSEAPGLAREAIGWLQRHDVALLATDTFAVNVVPHDEDGRSAFHAAAIVG